MKIMSYIGSKWKGKRGIVHKKGFKKGAKHSFLSFSLPET